MLGSNSENSGNFRSNSDSVNIKDLEGLYGEELIKEFMKITRTTTSILGSNLDSVIYRYSHQLNTVVEETTTDLKTPLDTLDKLGVEWKPMVSGLKKKGSAGVTQVVSTTVNSWLLPVTFTE